MGARRPLTAPGLLTALALLLCPAPASAQFVAPEGSNFHNGSSLLLADDGGARPLLATFEEALTLGDGAEAAHALGLLRDRPGVDLLRFGARTHVPALERAAAMLEQAQLAPSLLDELLDGERRRVAQAVAERDLETLLDHATRGVSLPSSEPARWNAARLLFEQGRFWEAGALAARCPDRAGAPALVAAADAHLAGPPPRPSPGPWDYAFSFRERLNHHPAAAPPLVTDGRPGQVLLVDSIGLVGIDVPGAKKAYADFDWGKRVLGMAGFFFEDALPRQHSVARSGDRLVFPFNVIGEPGLPSMRWTSPPARRNPELVAIDLPLGEGPRLAWRARLPASDQSVALGPPVVAGDRVFSLAFRIELQAEVSLCAFSLETGELLWRTPLVRSATSWRFASRRAELDTLDVDKRAREGAPAVRAGVVYACTGAGILAAVDGVSGRVLHSFRYDRVFSLEKDVFDPAYLFDTGGWEHEPVRLFGQRVVMAPSDSRFLYMLAPEPGPAGQLIREDPIERMDRRQVVALLQDPAGGEAPAVLATRRRDGRSGLVLLSPDGHTLASSPYLPEGEDQTGPPARTGPLVLLPTDAGVRMFDATDITRAPALLPRLIDQPPPVVAWIVAEGLVVLNPDPDGVLHGAVWRQMR